RNERIPPYSAVFDRLEEAAADAAAAIGSTNVELVDFADAAAELVRPERHEERVADAFGVVLGDHRLPAMRLPAKGLERPTDARAVHSVDPRILGVKQEAHRDEVLVVRGLCAAPADHRRW